MIKKYDIKYGDTFNQWTVLYPILDENVKSDNKRYICRCSCGTEKPVAIYNLIYNRSKQCSECRNKRGSNDIYKVNQYDLSGEYGIGYMNNGRTFIFDIEDYEKIKDYCWHEDKDGYICANTKGSERACKKTVKMHRVIMGVTDSKIQVDHIKHDRSDNRKSQLRVTDNYHNGMNRQLLRNNTSGKTGVSWEKSKNKWHVRIGVNQKTIHLGSYEKLEDAIRVREEAEEKYYGEYSYNNSMNING